MTKTKFYNELDIPSKSVMIIHSLMTDKRLGKTGKARLTVAYVYGLLRRTCNLSLNNIKYHYNKKYNIIYEINRISTLVERSGLSQRTVRNALNLLEKYGYIKRYSNRIKHLTYITMPLVIEHHIKSKVTAQVIDKFLAPAKNAGGTGKNYHNHRQKLSEAPAKNDSRCNDSYLNDSHLSDSCCNVRDSAKASPTNNNYSNKRTKGNNNNNSSWISNTVKHNWGIPKQVIKLIGNNAKTPKIASDIFKSISTCKGKINTKYKGTYYKGYYRNENNPYIQGQGLINTLNQSFKNSDSLKDLQDNITNDYEDYLNDHTNLQLRNPEDRKDQQIYAGFNKDTYEGSLNDIRKQIKKDKNDSNKLAKDKEKFHKWVHLTCKYTDLEPRMIRGTKAYRKYKATQKPNRLLTKVNNINAKLSKLDPNDPKYKKLINKKHDLVIYKGYKLTNQDLMKEAKDNHKPVKKLIDNKIAQNKKAKTPVKTAKKGFNIITTYKDGHQSITINQKAKKKLEAKKRKAKHEKEQKIIKEKTIKKSTFDVNPNTWWVLPEVANNDDDIYTVIHSRLDDNFEVLFSLKDSDFTVGMLRKGYPKINGSINHELLKSINSYIKKSHQSQDSEEDQDEAIPF